MHTTVAIELIGGLSRRALRAALDHIVCRHQLLRTVFRQVDGAWMAFVGPADRGFTLLEQDVGAEHETMCILRDEEGVPFCVSSGPLIRARLLQLATDHHFLLISVHPLVCDRASLVLMLGELRTLYGVFTQGSTNILSTAAQYADYALEQSKTLTPHLLEEQLIYWKRTLLGAQDLGLLRTDRPRSAIQLYSTGRHRLRLSEELTDNFGKLAVRSNVCLLAVLLSAWSVLLHRWSGQHDLIIGVLLANRPLAHADCLIGPFENLLPIRVAISPSTTVARLLAQVDATLSAAVANQDLPIHAIGESLRSLRDGRPIIQTALSLSQTSLDAAIGGAFAFGDLEVAKVWEERCKSKLEISIAISRANGELVADFEYAEELFERSTVERVCAWWTSLCSALVNAPGFKVSRLPMMATAARESVVRDFNNEYFSCLKTQRIDDMFESCAELTPEAVALVDGARVVSYVEINGRANQLARILKRRGACSGELIAVPSNPGIEGVIALIAVLKAGCAYIAGAPTELRNGAFRAGRHQAPRMFIVVTWAEVTTRMNDEQIIAFDADGDEISRESMENLSRGGMTACDLACAVLSVDRMGRRRWMLIEHRNVTSMVVSLDERLHFTRFDVWSLAHSLSSEVALVELWNALLYGAQVTVIPAHVMRDPEVLRRFLALGGVTVLNQKPSEFIGWSDTAGSSSQHGLHTVILSGEPLRPAALKGWFDVGRRWPQIIYLYRSGPTIAGAYSKVTQLDARRKSEGRLAGVPLSCSRLYVLDRYHQPVPIGVVGEIYVAGDSVARGYIERRQHFYCVRDPFSVDPNAKLWKTGDQGYWTAEGQIELASPKTGASSLEVEAARVECELMSHPAVRQAKVIVRRNSAGGDSFVAYVEGVRKAPSATELRAYLEWNVPAYMVPKEFHCQGRRGAKE